MVDMNDLRNIVEHSITKRAKEISSVDEIIQEEMNLFFKEQETPQIGPLIRALRESFEDCRKAEMERFLKKFCEKDQPNVERLTRDLINKLLHSPTIGLRSLAGQSESNLEKLLWTQHLFGLDDHDEKKGKS